MSRNSNLEFIVQKKEEGYSYKAIGNMLGGLHRDNIRSKYRGYKRRMEKMGDISSKREEVEENESISKSGNENTMTVSTKSSRIRTVEDALKYAEVDMNIWEVSDFQISSWEIARKNTKKNVKYKGDKKDGYEKDKGDLNTQTLWQIKIKLKKKINYPLMDALYSIVEDLRYNPPLLHNTERKIKNNNHLMEISLVDSHFGKLCINGEGIEESKELYTRAVDNLIEKSKGFDIDEIILPLGSDFFHIDNEKNTTTKGTSQEVDSHITDIFKIGCQSVVESIYRSKEIAPVEILYIPGNHDYMTSFYLCEFIKAWFRNDDHVTVNTDKLPRKYKFYGKNLIGFTHGKEEKVNDLARLIMSENFNDPRISDIQFLEFHRGHFHKKRELQYVSGDTAGNVKIVQLPSLSGTDTWHYWKGFVGAQRTAEAYIYNREFGNVGNFVCNVEEIL